MKRWPTFAKAATTVLLGAFALTSCGTTTQEEKKSTDAAYPVVVNADGKKVTIKDKPKRIVSLSPTVTEMLFVIGAGDQVKAVDDQSNYPQEAPKTELSGFTPNIDSISKYDPDLVILTTDANGIVSSLNKTGIPVIVEPIATEIDDVYDQLGDLGTATGNKEKAEEVVSQMRKQIDEAVAESGDRSKKITYFYESDTTYYTATSKSLVGKLLAKFGLANVMDEADNDGVDDGYAKVSAEAIISANPEVIFLADTIYGKQTPETVANRPGWGEVSAVKNNNIVALNDDIASRWGPRLGELAKQVGAAVKKARGEI